MASAARLAPAANSEASSTVRLGSWLITDETIPIITCRRRILRASSSDSVDELLAGCGLFEWPDDSPEFIVPSFNPQFRVQVELFQPAPVLRTVSRHCAPISKEINSPKVPGLGVISHLCQCAS